MGVCCVVLAAAVPARADDQADAQALLDRAIKAGGGEANLSKSFNATWKSKGKLHDSGLTFTSEEFFQAPDRLREVVVYEDGQGQKTKILSILNGDKGWTRTGDEDPEDMDKDALAQEQEEAYLNWVTALAPLKDKAFRLTVLGEIKVDDRPALGLRVSRKDRADVKLYFDKENALLVKTERKRKDVENNKEVNEEVFYRSYKDVQGVQQPMKFEVKWDGQAYGEFEITDIKFPEKLEDNLFTKPRKDLE
jgi:hypothetical protein